MTAWLVSFCVAFGLIIGSFLNVVVWRVPRGESIVHPPSHCPSCDAPVRPRDNVPVVSWLLLRGRCRDCSAPISARYPAVELATAGMFGALALRFGADPVLPAFLYLGAISIALALIDLDVRRLPGVITYPSFVIAPLLLAVALSGDRWELDDWVRALLGGVALCAVYLALFVAYPAGMGFGDVKLAAILGVYLAWLGWDIWAVGLVGGFITGGGFGVALLALGRAGRKTKVPFGPFMLAGALLAVFAGEPIADAWLGV